MGNSMSSFNRKLTSALNEDTLAVDTPVPENPLTQLRDKAQELRDARDKIAQLEAEYAQAIDQLNGQLAIGVKRRSPRLNASLRNGLCNVGFRSKSLNFKPDLDTRTWSVDSADKAFARRFGRRHGPATALNDDLEELVMAIIKFFTTHYKSL